MTICSNFFVSKSHVWWKLAHSTSREPTSLMTGILCCCAAAVARLPRDRIRCHVFLFAASSSSSWEGRENMEVGNSILKNLNICSLVLKYKKNMDLIIFCCFTLLDIFVARLLICSYCCYWFVVIVVDVIDVVYDALFVLVVDLVCLFVVVITWRWDWIGRARWSCCWPACSSSCWAGPSPAPSEPDSNWQRTMEYGTYIWLKYNII